MVLKHGCVTLSNLWKEYQVTGYIALHFYSCQHAKQEAEHFSG